MCPTSHTLFMSQSNAFFFNPFYLFFKRPGNIQVDSYYKIFYWNRKKKSSPWALHPPSTTHNKWDIFLGSWNFFLRNQLAFYFVCELIFKDLQNISKWKKPKENSCSKSPKSQHASMRRKTVSMCIAPGGGREREIIEFVQWA